MLIRQAALIVDLRLRFSGGSERIRRLVFGLLRKLLKLYGRSLELAGLLWLDQILQLFFLHLLLLLELDHLLG